jgi:hypothetical protein
MYMYAYVCSQITAMLPGARVQISVVKQSLRQRHFSYF